MTRRARRLRPHALPLAAAAMLTAAALLSGCSSGDAPTGVDPTGAAAVIVDPQDQPAEAGPIAETIVAAIEASNTDDVDRFRALVCAAEQGRYTDLPPAAQPADPVTVTAISDLTVGGSTADAQVELTTGSGAATITQVWRMDLTYEGGQWKFCRMALVG